MTFVGVVAAWGLSSGMAAPPPDAYQDLEARQKQLSAKVNDQLKAVADAEAERKQLIQDRKQLAAEMKAAKSRSAPVIDYSKYDRCPNGKSWDQCDHVREKAEWLEEQLDKRKRFEREMEKIMSDFQQRQKAINDSLDSYFKKVDSLNKTAGAAVSEREKLVADIKNVAKLSGAEMLRTGDFGKDRIKAATDAVMANKAQFAADGNGTKCNFYQQTMAYKLTGRNLPELQGRANDIADQLAKSVADKEGKFTSLNFQGDRQAALDRAQDLADQGKYVVIVYKNPEAGKSGHIASVAPLKDGDKMPASPRVNGVGLGLDRIPYISQAGPSDPDDGESVHDYYRLSQGFGYSRLSNMEIYVYDPLKQATTK